MLSKYPGQRISLKSIYLHKWVRKYYYDKKQRTQTEQFEVRTEKCFEEDRRNQLQLDQRSRSELLESIENEDECVPSEDHNNWNTSKKKYELELHENKFFNTSDYLPSKNSVSTNELYSSKKWAHEPLRQTDRLVVDFKESMKLNSVRQSFIVT